MTRNWKDIVIAVLVSVVLATGGSVAAFGGDKVTKEDLASAVAPYARLTEAVVELRIEIGKLSTIIDERTSK